MSSEEAETLYQGRRQKTVFWPPHVHCGMSALHSHGGTCTLTHTQRFTYRIINWLKVKRTNRTSGMLTSVRTQGHLQYHKMRGRLKRKRIMAEVGTMAWRVKVLVPKTDEPIPGIQRFSRREPIPVNPPHACCATGTPRHIHKQTNKQEGTF